jgi:G3E family GTPase
VRLRRDSIRAVKTMPMRGTAGRMRAFSHGMTRGRIPVDILTGFLGSGKTTLLNRLLADGAFADTAVVVNELGEIGLDHLLVAELSDQVALLEGGCLCCAVVDSLPETLLELCRGRAGGELPPFRRIVIETTGLADPGPIMTVVSRSPLLANFLGEGIVVTSLDMLDWEATVARHPEALRQLVLADRVVMTKLDLRSGIDANERSRIEALNPVAEIVHAATILLAPDLLLAPAPLHAPWVGRGADGHAHHTHGVRAWSFVIDQPVTRAGLAAFARAVDVRLGDTLLRCKGIVCIGARTMIVQGVGRRFVTEPASPAMTGATPHLTVIVQGHERAAIAALLPWLHVAEGTMPPAASEMDAGPTA